MVMVAPKAQRWPYTMADTVWARRDGRASTIHGATKGLRPGLCARGPVRMRRAMAGCLMLVASLLQPPIAGVVSGMSGVQI